MQPKVSLSEKSIASRYSNFTGIQAQLMRLTELYHKILRLQVLQCKILILLYAQKCTSKLSSLVFSLGIAQKCTTNPINMRRADRLMKLPLQSVRSAARLLCKYKHRARQRTAAVIKRFFCLVRELSKKKRLITASCLVDF